MQHPWVSLLARTRREFKKIEKNTLAYEYKGKKGFNQNAPTCLKL
jgi:hypothetical protein